MPIVAGAGADGQEPWAMDTVMLQDFADATG